MALFNRNKDNTNQDNINNIIRTQTVTINGKVVSDNDPRVKAMMDKMQRQFGAAFTGGNTINEYSNPGDVADYVENQLRMAGVSNTAKMPNVDKSFFSSYTPTFESQPRIFECKSCGAKNTINPGDDSVCEYCGSGLK